MNELLHNRCREQSFTPLHVCEIGVYMPETSNILGFIRDGARATLVEAAPDIIQKLRDYFDNYPNVTIIPFAVYDRDCNLELCRAGASTFVKNLPASPALENDGFNTASAQLFTVEARRFDGLDDGSIDLLSIDTEGCEWHALKYLQSRPKVISLETGFRRYTNPFLKEILRWMDLNNYEIWYKDKSDTVFMQKRAFGLPALHCMLNRIAIYRLRRRASSK